MGEAAVAYGANEPDPDEFDALIARTYEPVIVDRQRALGWRTLQAMEALPVDVPNVPTQIAGLLRTYAFHPASGYEGFARTLQN